MGRVGLTCRSGLPLLGSFIPGTLLSIHDSLHVQQNNSKLRVSPDELLV
jgi:hypothetical protein